jgi:ATP diphosphatase
MRGIERLLTIMHRLRDPQQGCPWDLAQTYKTIVPHTLEEAYEVADAIEREDYTDLRDELGDLLFQVVFYAQLAEEDGRFDFNEIANGIADKLVRRHPHVFADMQFNDAEEQTRHWEELKKQERADKAETTQHSVLDGIARTLPALSLAGKMQKRAAQVGFDWPEWSGVIAKVQEELAELQESWSEPQRREEELGDLLFTCVNLARHAGCDPEAALRAANHKFDARFRALELAAQAQGRSLEQLSPDELDQLWNTIKKSSK